MAFCRAVQQCCPIGSYIQPVPGEARVCACACVCVCVCACACACVGYRSGARPVGGQVQQPLQAGVRRAGLLAPMRAVRLHDSLPLRAPPCAGVTPGYGDEVIFADGTFIDGSTAELSADGPIRPPYVVYCQVRPLCDVHEKLGWRCACLGRGPAECGSGHGGSCPQLPPAPVKSSGRLQHLRGRQPAARTAVGKPTAAPGLRTTGRHTLDPLGLRAGVGSCGHAAGRCGGGRRAVAAARLRALLLPRCRAYFRRSSHSSLDSSICFHFIALVFLQKVASEGRRPPDRGSGGRSAQRAAFEH